MSSLSQERTLKSYLDKIQHEYEDFLAQIDTKDLTSEEKGLLADFERHLQSAYEFTREYQDELLIHQAGEDLVASPEARELVAMAIGDITGYVPVSIQHEVAGLLLPESQSPRL